MPEELELRRLLESYRQSIEECDIEGIATNGLKYYQKLRNGEATSEDNEKMQNEILDAKSWRMKPL